MSKNVKTIATADYAAVAATMQIYVDSLKAGNAQTMRAAFHKDAMMYGDYNGAMFGGPLDSYFGFLETSGPAPDVEARIDVLAMTPTIAVVRVDMEKDQLNMNYIDFHTLVKQDGEWKVVLKVYQPYER